jgi:regulation of enolase protein 1 (concanavalin A-like superfamily)
MRYQNRKILNFSALTILEIIVALAIITIVFAAVLPQFRVIQNGWDSRQANTEVIQNGRVLIDHICCNLSKAVKITDVSESSDTNGFIVFEDNDGNSRRYDVNSTINYVEYGLVSSLSDLAGPVSSLTFTCYDACDLSNPLSPVTDVNVIRAVKVDVVITNSGSLGKSKTFTALAYLRTNGHSSSNCWQHQDIGDVGADGSAYESDGTWTIDASGSDIWNTSDEFHYVYQSLSGDGQIIARVVSVEYTNSWAKAGVMIRETLDGNSKHAMMVVTPGNGMAFQRRTTTGGSSDHTAGSFVTAPYWVKLVRSGNTFSGYESADGSTWTLVGSVSITMATDVYIGLSVTSHSDGDLCTAEIDSVGFSTVEYKEFTEAKAESDTTSITIPTPGSVNAVTILGSWLTGTTHAKESGTNRALVFVAHAKGLGNTVTLNTVTYGGQTMTKIVERRQGSSTSTRVYVAAFILNEAGISAESGDNFSVSWSSNPTYTTYDSVFLRNVNQTASLYGATGNNGVTGGTSVSTSALATSDGDMVIEDAAGSVSGTYTVTTGWTKDVELGSANPDGMDGHKPATGVAEIPSVTSSASGNHALIGFVVNVNEEVRGIKGDLLIAAVATDGDTSSSLAPLFIDDWNEINVNNYGNAVTLGAWYKFANDSEPISHEFTWSGGQQAYGWIMHFTGHNPNNTVNAWSAGTDSNSTPTSPSVKTTVDNCLILRLGAFDNDDVNTLPEPGNPGLSGHTAITMDKSATSFATLLQDDFETDLSKWTTNWDMTTAQKHLGSYSVHCGSAQTTLTSNDMNTLGYSNIHIVLWYRDQGIDDNDDVFLQLYNGVTYTNRSDGELGITSPELTWHEYDTTIYNSGSEAQYFRTDFRIRINGNSIDTGENLWIDDVIVTVTLDGTVSGGAGYVGQASSGDSGTSTFALTSSNASQMLTIAIAPADTNICEGSIYP